MAATDGVGTKLRIAIDTGNVDTIGIDLVAMCVNDLVCQGAEPLFFLDYFATGKLEVDQAARIIDGHRRGLRGHRLRAGRAARRPRCRACITRAISTLRALPWARWSAGRTCPQGVRTGDVLLGLASDGVHSNGYSFVRKVVELSGLGWDAPAPFADGTLGRRRC